MIKDRMAAWLRGMKRPKMALRIPALFIAVTLMGLGVAVFDRIGFGTDPCSTMNLGISRKLGMPFGTMQLLINIAMLLVVIRFGADRIGLGTLANMVLVGYAAEFFMHVLDGIPAMNAMSLGMRIAVFVPTMLMFLVAASVYMDVEMGVAPYDALPQIIAKKSGLSFRAVRIAWDTFMMVGGFFLGSTVGAVTLVLAFGLGPMIAYVARKIEPFFS